MDRTSLRDAIHKLAASTLGPKGSSFAYDQAVAQFDALLLAAKALFPERADMQAMQLFSLERNILKDFLEDSVRRLKDAIDLRPITSAIEILAGVKLPSDTPPEVVLDFVELEESLQNDLKKTALLLAGSIAEALLLLRHSDQSERGPGLLKLVNQARDVRLFGKDTLKYLETLVDYRDLIHPRAQKRNKIVPNQARVETAVTALKLLCVELEDLAVRYP